MKKLIGTYAGIILLLVSMPTCAMKEKIVLPHVKSSQQRGVQLPPVLTLGDHAQEFAGELMTSWWSICDALPIFLFGSSQQQKQLNQRVIKGRTERNGSISRNRL